MQGVDMKKIYVILTFIMITALLLPACAPAAADCRRAEVFCVGLVTNIGTIDDQSANQAAWEGMQQAEKDLGAHVQFIETTEAKEYAGNIATFGDKGYDVIVTVGSALGEYTAAAAATYPEIDFIGVDQFQAETVDGVAGVIFAEDHAGFLVGAMAALMSKSNKIGAVCGTHAVPSNWRFGEGYKAGAAFADQLRGLTTNVLLVYHSDPNPDETFTDLEWGGATAKTMIDQGADAIFGCGGTMGHGAITAAAQAGVYAIGADTDQYLTVPEAAPRLLSSAMKLIGPSVFELIKLSKEGQLPSGNYLGSIDYAPFHDLDEEVPNSVRQMMEQIKTGLLNSSIQTNVPPISQ
jgi:basic membrane protein A and related proteins